METLDHALGWAGGSYFDQCNHPSASLEDWTLCFRHRAEQPKCPTGLILQVKRCPPSRPEYSAVLRKSCVNYRLCPWFWNSQDVKCSKMLCSCDWVPDFTSSNDVGNLEMGHCSLAKVSVTPHQISTWEKHLVKVEIKRPIGYALSIRSFNVLLEQRDRKLVCVKRFSNGICKSEKLQAKEWLSVLEELPSLFIKSGDLCMPSECRLWVLKLFRMYRTTCKHVYRYDTGTLEKIQGFSSSQVIPLCCCEDPCDNN